MEVFVIPVEDKFIIYRPLRHLAFVGNEAMADLARQLAAEEDPQERLGERGGAPSVWEFLERIGFLEPDPPPPPPRQRAYRPTNVVLLLTSRCNLRCIYCYANAGLEAAEDLPLEVAQAAIDEGHANAVALGRPHFKLTFHGGGEPTCLWQTMVEAWEYAQAKDLPCHASLVSNGVWTDSQRDWIIPNLNELTISFDGRQETQDAQRPLASGRGSFQAVMKSLHKLDEQGFRYGIRMTALAPWRGRLARDVEFLFRETGCRSIQVEPAFNTERGEYESPLPEEVEDFVDGFMEAFEVAQRAGRRLVYSGARPWLLTHSFCSAPYGGLIVTPAGKLVTCYEVTSPRHPLAKLCTVGQIEDGRVRVDAAARSAVLDRLEARREACRDCFCHWHCGGDCHAKTLYPGADTEPITSSRCQINRRILAQMLLWHMAEAEDGIYRGWPAAR